MKTLLAAILTTVACAAHAQSQIQACTNERGETTYGNVGSAAKGGKHCRKVEMDAVSVIPPQVRKKRLPIAIGMSQEQVRNNWGKPDKVTRIQSRDGISEQWVYAGGTLTFANGALEVIQY